MEVKTYPQSGSIEKKGLRLLLFFNLHVNSMYTLHRQKYKDAQAQLLKGKNMFEKVLKSLTNLPGWSYRGLVCFTEIENREVFTSELEELSEDEIKVSVCVSKVN